MAKQMCVMRFGQYKGQNIAQVPTDYLLWVFGSFPKLRTQLVGVLAERGLSPEDTKALSRRHPVLGKAPESDERRRRRRMKPKKKKRTDEQKKANALARIMGHDIPYPRYEQPKSAGESIRKGPK